MNLIDPILANFKNITGSFPQATGHYSKKFNELEGMYGNERNFKKCYKSGKIEWYTKYGNIAHRKTKEIWFLEPAL